jgi:hypothetical protein
MGTNYKIVGQALLGGLKELKGFFSKNRADALPAEDDEDPAKPEDRVATWEWTSGLLVSSIFTIIVLKAQFNVPVGETILAIILAFLLSFIGLQASGETDINPVGVIAKATQLVFGGISKVHIFFFFFFFFLMFVFAK